jgi:DnaJ-domain-containing protein 1
LTVEKNAAWQARDEARRANPVTIITKAQYALLQKAFHPDQEHDTATPERKQQLLDAAKVFYALGEVQARIGNTSPSAGPWGDFYW